LLTKAKEAFSAAAEDMAPEQRAQILQSIELARRTVAEQQEDIISELSMLRVLASTGTMIVVFQHQLLGTLAALKDAHTALSTFVAKLTAKDRNRFEEELVRLNRWVETTQHQAQLLGLLVARKSRSRRHRIAVRPVVESLKQAFDSYAADYGIEVQNTVPEGLRTPPMFDAELSAVFVNLLTNAFKAVRDQPVRRISVEGKRVDSSVSLRVQDTGSGLARENPDEYFKPFVGDSEPDPILGEGTGLGLKIVKDFIDVYGGQARFVPALAPWRTAIEIVLPEN
jgi:C4-dicarboxylate-specific signal transduction histidine kinase